MTEELVQVTGKDRQDSQDLSPTSFLALGCCHESDLLGARWALTKRAGKLTRSHRGIPGTNCRAGEHSRRLSPLPLPWNLLSTCWSSRHPLSPSAVGSVGPDVSSVERLTTGLLLSEVIRFGIT